MKKKLTEKINGFGIVMRFVTPLLVAINIAMVTYILDDLKDVKTKLDDHLQHAMVIVSERLTALEVNQRLFGVSAMYTAPKEFSHEDSH